MALCQGEADRYVLGVFMEIKVDTQELMNDKERITYCAEELEGYMNQLEDIIFSVSGEWQGATEVAFTNRLIAMKMLYAKLIKSLDDYAQLIGTIGKEYDEYDRSIAQKINLV